MDSDCLVKSLTKLQIELHPSKLQDVNAGILQHLSSLLFKYQDDLEGIVMAWDKGVQILKKAGAATIHPYFPLVHIEVKTNMLLFKPRVGSLLVGKVIKVANDFIGLLVLGLFNASIPADQIRSEFKFNNGQSAWISKKKPEHRLQVGTEVKFKVVRLLSDSSIFGMIGSLVDKKSTGALHYIREGAQEEAVADPEASGLPAAESKKDKKAKRKALEGRDQEPEEGNKIKKKQKKDHL